jgi:transcription antitermination factor NusG
MLNLETPRAAEDRSAVQNDPTVIAWFVVRTKPRQEAQAKSNLELRRVPVFLPHIVELGYGAQEAPSKRPAPLFPGYLFARMAFPIDYHRVIWAPGVRDVICSGANPIPVGDHVIKEIRERCDARGVVRSVPRAWNPGDRVEIPNGPFAGLLATVVTVMTRRRRIKLLIDFLARQTCVEMPVSSLRNGSNVAPRPARAKCTPTKC